MGNQYYMYQPWTIKSATSEATYGRLPIILEALQLYVPRSAYIVDVTVNVVVKLLSPLDDAIIYLTPLVSPTVVPVLSVNCHVYCTGVGLASNSHINVASSFSITVISDAPVVIATGTIGDSI